MNLTLDEVEELLEQKIRKEFKRNKTYGTRAKPYDIAHSLAPNVLALTSLARWYEISKMKSRVNKKFQLPRKQARIILKWLKTRERELAIQKEAVQRWAGEKETSRPWKRQPLELSSSKTPKKKKSS